MKKTLLLIPFMLLVAGIASAQFVNKDSISLVKKIEADKEKLAKMKASVPDAEDQKKRTAEHAQESADDNRKAASKLSDDPQDRQLARKADNAASDARSDSRKARKASDHLDDLNKDIRDLTERIEKEESKLNKYVVAYQAAVQAAPVQPMPVKDTSHIKD